MSTVRRRRLAATALAVTAGLTLAGCGTSFDAQTNKVYQASVGADHRGEVDVLNTLFVINDDKTATLSASVINNGDTDQELVSVTVTDFAGKELQVSSADKRLPVPAGILSTIGGSSDAGGLRVTGAEPGKYVKATLTFSEAAPVTIEAPVVARSAEYDKVAGAEPLDAPTAEVADSAKQGAEGVDK